MNRRLVRIVSWVGVCLAVVVGISTRPIGAQTTEPSTAAVQVWIDAPLDGTVVTDASAVVVTAHLAHPDGVRGARLRVRLTDSAPVELGGGALETVQLTWQPPGDGVYPISVAGRADGGWSTSATVLVVVDGADDSTGTTTTTTSTTTTTTAPTVTTTVVGVTTTRPPPSVTTTVPSATTTDPPRPTTTVAATTTTTPTTTTATPTTTTTTTATTTTTTTVACSNNSPVVTGPASNARLFYVVSWTYSGCTPSGFRVIVSEDVGLTDVIADATVGSADRTYDAFSVEPCREYFVRVSALFGSRVAPSHSAIHSFVTAGC